MSTPILEVFLVKVVFLQWLSVPNTVRPAVAVNRHNRDVTIILNLPQNGLVRCRNVQGNALMVGVIVDVSIGFPVIACVLLELLKPHLLTITIHFHNLIKGIELSFAIVPAYACNDVVHVQFLFGHVLFSLYCKHIIGADGCQPLFQKFFTGISLPSPVP
ncbi:MAG: hypothetical protein WCS17_14010 [Prevotella sp.]